MLTRCLVVLLFLTSSTLTAQTTYIKAGRLFDGKSETMQRNIVIAIDGPNITSVGPNIAIPAGAKVIDLSERTVMPGMIDAHTHIVLHAGDYEGQILRETPEFRAIRATVDARKTLEAGINTIRDLGNEGAGFADVALRDAIAKGLVRGPRIIAAIRPVATTGGYRLTGYSPYYQWPPLASIADGPAEMRREVRKLIEQGADLIKIYMESYEKKQLRQDILTGAMIYADDEVNAIVEEAHRSGVRVAAHTYTDDAGKQAIRAGVDTIEHGLYLSDETLRLMAQKGIYYTPTLLVYEFWRDSKIFGQISPQNKIKLTNTVREHTETFRRALKSGVKIVFGSDTFELPGTNAHELDLLVRYGMKPIDALRSATSVAAAALGVDDVGIIAPGKIADIIAVEGDPASDITALQRVRFVMTAGKVLE